MCIGFTTAPATYQRIMDQIFRRFSEFVIPYFDDIIVFSNDEVKHTEHLRLVFEQLRTNNIKLNRAKSKLYQRELKILGNAISHSCIKPDPKKITSIKTFQQPKTVQELRSFFGIINYCREYISNLASIAAPLSDISKEILNTSKPQ